MKMDFTDWYKNKKIKLFLEVKYKDKKVFDLHRHQCCICWTLIWFWAYAPKLFVCLYISSVISTFYGLLGSFGCNGFLQQNRMIQYLFHIYKNRTFTLVNEHKYKPDWEDRAKWKVVIQLNLNSFHKYVALKSLVIHKHKEHTFCSCQQ